MPYTSFRQLYEGLVFDRDPVTVPAFLLGEGLRGSRHLLGPLEHFRQRAASVVERPVDEEPGMLEALWELYALSRVNDHLLLPFQLADSFPPEHVLEIIPHARHIELRVVDSRPTEGEGRSEVSPITPNQLIQVPSEGGDGTIDIRGERAFAIPGRIVSESVPRLTLGVYLDFFRALGFEPFGRQSFSPFHHEIVEVEEVEELGSQIEITREFWPGLMFGEMLFSRSGVGIRCSGEVVSKAIAERSRLYWAYRRVRRSTEDRSMDWGHNSQWHTAFRRDYEDAYAYHFNVDAFLDLAGTTEDIDEPIASWGPRAARRELLINRCFVRCTLPDAVWPWYDKLTVRKENPLGPV